MESTTLSLKIVFNSEAMWVPINSSYSVSQLLNKWGDRAGVSSAAEKYSLFLLDGELYDHDNLKSLNIQQRDVLHVLPKPQRHVLHQHYPPTHQQKEPPSLPPTSVRESSFFSGSVIAAPITKELPTPSRPPISASINSQKFSTFFYQNLENVKTIKPVKQMNKLSTKKQDLFEIAKNNLQNCDHFKNAIVLPEGKNESDWLTLLMISFFNNANIIYSKFSHCCTTESCPHTQAGAQNYLWMDAVKKVPIDIPAPEYFNNLFEWILKDNIEDENKIPSLESDEAYPNHFNYTIGDISRRIFRVYAHLYHHHYTEISENSILPIEQFEKSFELFYYFVSQFKLVSDNDLVPMKGLIDVIIL